MPQNYAFLQFGTGITLTVAGNTVTTTLGGSTVGLPPSAARIYNAGTAGLAAYVMFGTVTAVTVTNGMPFLPAGQPQVVRTGNNPVIQVVSATTTTVNLAGGEGIS